MKFCVAVIFATAACSTAVAADVTIQLDPAQTQVLWTLGDVFHTVHGTFRLTRGQIQFDPATGKASGEIVVDATSGESGNGSRDKRMHRSVLESSKYPAIVFSPEQIEGPINLDADSDVELRGTFAIHGGEHSLTAPAKIHFSDSRMTGSIDFAVPYVKWGMKDPSTLFLRVKDSVEIHFQAVGAVQR